MTTSMHRPIAGQDVRVPGRPADTEAELAEVLAEVLHEEHVPVDGHFFDDLGADSMTMARFCARVRKRDELPAISIKDVYEHPTIRGLATALAPAVVEPASVPAETALAEVLAEVLRTDRVAVDAHFFDELGADSMTMAQFCARVRKRDELPSLSITDVYAHPTARGLARAVADADAVAQPAPVGQPAPVTAPAPAPTGVGRRASTLEYVLCGTLQVLLFLGYAWLAAVVTIEGARWMDAAPSLAEQYLRTVLVVTGQFLALCALPVLLKWVLVGRWKPQQIRIWSLRYLRFWFVRTLITFSPMRLFVGTPLYTLYLRMLGANIGRGVLILTPNVPACTDLLTIGDRTVIRKDSYLNCYRAHSGVIETGPVTLGTDVLVSEATVLDIDTVMGDGAQLGHASSLHAGQVVPAGDRWHGSPAQPCDVDYRMTGPSPRRRPRGWLHSAGQLLLVLLVYLPLAIGGVEALLSNAQISALEVDVSRDWNDGLFYLEALIVSLILFFGAIFIGMIFVLAVPRLLHLGIKEDRVYPLYGFHYTLHRTLTRLTNSKFLTALFGDSSYIVHYLRALGYQLTPLVQTGSNFGMDVRQDNPFLCTVGTGTVCASELSMINADYTSTSFRVSRASIGRENFLGNLVAFPARARTGDNCLLATKVLVPIDGTRRRDVGLLGSPSFEIPRSVARDSTFIEIAGGPDLPRLLAAKNRHNTGTMGLLLLARAVHFFGTTLIGLSALALFPRYGGLALAVATVLNLFFSLFYGVLVERASTGFRPLPSKYCSIYDIDFWREERFFKLELTENPLFFGTPFKGLIYRMLGVHVGRRLFDDGGSIIEKNLVTIGDDVTLNAGCWIQCHTQEDYAFKSGPISIGSGCTVGVAAMILYGADMAEGSVLAPDSFLMKGEEVPPNARWGGNPAREMSEAGPTLRVRSERTDDRSTPGRPALSARVALNGSELNPEAVAAVVDGRRRGAWRVAASSRWGGGGAR